MNIRCTGAALLLAGALVPLGAFAQTPASPRGGGPRPVVADPTTPELKAEVLGLLGQWQALFRGNPAVSDALERSRAQLEAMSSAQVQEVAPILAGRIADLRQLTGMAAEGIREMRTPSASTGFPVAPYPNVGWDWLVEGFEDEDDVTGSDSGSGSGNCNLANAPSAAFLYSLQTIQTVVDAIAAVADRICNQFGSAVVAGANLSAVCIVTDIGAVVAQAFNGNWNNCSDWIMAAEVSGSYSRLEHLHDDVVAAESNLTTELDANETLIDALDAAVVAHDQNLTDRADLIDAALSATATFLMEFLDERLQLRIEDYLAASENSAIASFQLPEAFDGLLELIQEIVTDTVAAENGGLEAQGFLAAADAAFTAGRYKTAFENYGKAYRAAVVPAS